MKCTWIKGKHFEHQFCTFDSTRDHRERINLTNEQRSREAAPEAGRTKTIHTNEDRQSQGTFPMPTYATKPLTTSSTISVELQQKYMVGQHGQQLTVLQFDKFPDPQSFSAWIKRFKNQATTFFDFPSDAMSWIKEVEMVDSLYELKSPRSVYGEDFPINNIVQKRRAVSKSRKTKRRVGSYEEDRSLSWSTTTFEWLALMIPN